MASIQDLRQELVGLDEREGGLKQSHLLCFKKTEECQKKRDIVIKKVDKLKVNF